MARMEVLVGPIASGKSTYARRRADEGALVISHDDLTQMLHTRYRYESGLRECYRKIEESIAWAVLTAGRDVVVDRTHLTRESRNRWLNWVSWYVSLNTFDDRGPEVPVVAVAFPIQSPFVHANRRFRNDSRGRSMEEWIDVAIQNVEQARTEPLSEHEGFTEILRIGAPEGVTLG
jgi:hypothetical protein